MNYWEGIMNWGLDTNWKCKICGKNFGLEWGITHAQCRCNNCHAEYRMRDNENKIVTTPILQVKPDFVAPAISLFLKTGDFIDLYSSAQWKDAGAPIDN